MVILVPRGGNQTTSNGACYVGIEKMNFLLLLKFQFGFCCRLLKHENFSRNITLLFVRIFAKSGKMFANFREYMKITISLQPYSTNSICVKKLGVHLIKGYDLLDLESTQKIGFFVLIFTYFKTTNMYNSRKGPARKPI
jgi:hypothetical protein